LDDRWHHVAIQRRRSDGFLWMYLDGFLVSSGDGPDGDISYPDNYIPENPDAAFLSIGAWKQSDDYFVHPLSVDDELRIPQVYDNEPSFRSNSFQQMDIIWRLILMKAMAGAFDVSSHPDGPPMEYAYLLQALVASNGTPQICLSS
jgi:hypothetical protein